MLCLWLLLTASPAHALTGIRSGPYLELAAGLGMAEAPIHPGVGGQLSAGWWAGRYDDAYAFGRFWSLGPTLRVDYLPVSDDLRLEPMLEVRRGMDLFVAGAHGFVAGGPVWSSRAGAAVGGTVRGGLGLKLRRHRYWGVVSRLEGGVDVLGGQVGGAAGFLLGVGYARPRALPERASD